MKVVVYILLTTAFILLIYTRVDHERSFDRGLSRRFGLRDHAPIFDPLVANQERKSAPGADHVDQYAVAKENAQDYYSEEGSLNITLRIMVLFPWLDNAPKDGLIDVEELGAWNKKMAMNRLYYLTERELHAHDADGDGVVRFREYLPQLTDDDIVKNGMQRGQAGWWKVQFDNADADHDGSLTLHELKDFLHPEDSSNEKIQKWLLSEKIKRMDKDGDGKLNFAEFRNGAYDIYKNYVDFETDGADAALPEEKFDELDVDKDKLLTAEELLPILSYLHPGELSYAKYYTGYLFQEADENRDGKLNLDEMLKHEYVFYSTVYDETHDEADDFLHDEL